MINVKSIISNIKAKYYSSKYKTLMSNAVTSIVVASAIFTMYTGYKQLHDSPDKIIAYYTKSEFSKVVAYSGDIKNEDDLNADDFAFKGDFQAEVAKFEVKTPDVIEKKEENNPAGVAQFVLKRLTKGSQCEFDIIVHSNNKNAANMQISWKGGKGFIELKPMDRNFMRGIELSEEVRSINLSQKARSKWIDNNTKFIGVPK